MKDDNYVSVMEYTNGLKIGDKILYSIGYNAITREPVFIFGGN